MDFILFIFDSSPNIHIPEYFHSWIYLVILSALFILMLRKFGGFPTLAGWQRRLFLILLLGTPVFSSIFGIRLSLDYSYGSFQGLSTVPSGPVVSLLSSIPFVMASGFLGLVPSVLIGIASGFWLALWNTHSVFTIFEMAGLAFVFSILINPKFLRNKIPLMNHPILAAVSAGIILLPVYLLNMVLSGEYTFTEITGRTLFIHFIVRSLELFVAGFLAEGLFVFGNINWVRDRYLNPGLSGFQSSNRYFWGIGLMQCGLVLILVLFSWLAGGRTSREMLAQRMDGTARVVSETLPIFLETGESLILAIADELTEIEEWEDLQPILDKRINQVPFYDQLIVVDSLDPLVSTYAFLEDERNLSTLYPDEKEGIQQLRNGLPYQVRTVSPSPGQRVSQLTFMAYVGEMAGLEDGVVLGRTNLTSNPLMVPAVLAFESMNDYQGEGFILDEKNRILFYKEPVRNPEEKRGFASTILTVLGGLVQDDQLYLSNYYPVNGITWSVLLSFPVSQINILAVENLLPVLVLFLVMSAFTFLLFIFGMKNIGQSIKKLSAEAASIMLGNSDEFQKIDRNDDIGILAVAFERLNQDYSVKLDGLDKLVQVIQEASGKNELKPAILQILKGALFDGYVCVGVVMTENTPGNKLERQLITLKFGPKDKDFEYLSESLFDLLKNQKQLQIKDFGGNKAIEIPDGKKIPGSLIAFALQGKSEYFGAFYCVSGLSRSFSNDEIKLLERYAGQAAILIENYRLLSYAQKNLKQINAIIDSTPEPVLFVDEQLRLMVANPAAYHLPNLLNAAEIGSPIEGIIQDKKLRDLFVSPLDRKGISIEISLEEKSYHISIFPVFVNESLAGKLGIFRDVTHYKELDSMKSELVSTVSHDLRAPLTLLRGYGTMLEMVGELNDQQKGYVQKIIKTTESMSRLVGNLLDIGRIEAGINLNLEKVEAKEIIHSVVNLLQPQINQKKINFVLDIPEDRQILMEADAALIQQAMFNVLENAIKFSQVNGKVLLRLSRRNGNVVFEVLDTGIGIAPLDLPHVFEKFYKVGFKESSQYTGTGLGLSIVKSIVERHHGKVWVESQLGKGSGFYLEIPAHQNYSHK